MTKGPRIEIVLVGCQPFRCRWQEIEVAPGHLRHLVIDRGMVDRLDPEDLAEGFAMVHLVDGVDAASVGAVVEEIVAAGGELAAIATNDEYLVDLGARLREGHGLPGPNPSSVAIFTDKLAMKQAVQDAGLRSPAGMALDPVEAAADPAGLARRIEATCGLPVVLKPRSSANSLDVSVVRSAAELVDRCKLLERADFMAEEFIAGRVLFCDSLHDGSPGQRVTLMTALYANPPLQYRTGGRHGSRTLSDGPLSTDVEEFTGRILDALPALVNCVTHLEVLEHDGELWFLEVAARAPGAEVAHCGELYLGVNLEELNFRLQLGLPWHTSSPRGDVAWMWFAKRDGTVTECVPPQVTGPALFTWQVRVGDEVTGADHSPNNRREDAALIALLGPSDPEVLAADFAALEASDPVTYSDTPPTHMFPAEATL